MSSTTKPAKILLVSASVGDGHTQAALAIKTALENQKLFTAQMVDFMAGENSYLNTLVKEAYLKLIDIFPDIYDLLYRFSQMPVPGSKVQSLMAMAMKRSMLKLIEAHRPDALICTHPFPCGAAAYLKRNHKINLPLIGVITDFAIHRFWCYRETDLYFVATPELKQQLARQNIDLSRIHATGIPVNEKFSHIPSQVELDSLRRLLGFANPHPVILIMGGGLGLGDLEQAVLALDTLPLPLNLVVVTGRNATLRRSLLSKAPNFVHPLKVLGYTRHIPEFMSVADLLITKPGALTISEALSMKLPLLLYQAIPGHEEENAAYLIGKGAALWSQNSHSLTATVHDLLANPQQISSMREMATQIGRPMASQAIAAIIWQKLFEPDFGSLSGGRFI
ncbi:MGDG synthase family glycosyltransferase [Sporomusa acidovorans]|uniref:Processive diacylglycerol beta-glucosyltransferase n=1 Tax=Sporomusa acidovorans (strain ATCC 49682 / DSM 3132 / Mol) TaxID=1123286 RepID=A0ABZ3IWC3_SPOA4|nr:glycosyltransferase [Sporomusa acidovorans]OZC23674.1 processive diacylglycerol beta-glucosyltransferase [Sporomusa acidovorans DSM 3132]SDE24834.1 processive 1,2-diacylglycerol beta-glucosyltransferase [Sporomusa acidovorans]